MFRASFISAVICVSRSLIPALSTVCHMAPCPCASLSAVRSDCLQLSPGGQLIAARSNLKSEPQRAGAASGRRRRRLPSSRADRGQRGVDCRRGPFEHFNTEASRFFEVGSYRGELLCIPAFIRSDGDARSVRGRRFSKLEKAAGGHQTLPERRGRVLSSPLTNARRHILMCALPRCACLQLFNMDA